MKVITQALETRLQELGSRTGHPDVEYGEEDDSWSPGSWSTDSSQATVEGNDDDENALEAHSHSSDDSQTDEQHEDEQHEDEQHVDEQPVPSDRGLDSGSFAGTFEERLSLVSRSLSPEM